ncbi:MAG: M1 family metallopeptidase [Lacibacter sp.]
MERYMKKQLLLLCAACLWVVASLAQSKYDHREAFHPSFYPYPGNEYRSAGGQPGPRYWQNRADYRIACTLDPQDHKVTGTVTLRYTNNSPDALGFLWLQLDQNIYRSDSRGTATTTTQGGRWANAQFTDGYVITKTELRMNGAATAPKEVVITDTRMQVWLPQPLAAGASLELTLDYAFTIPEYGTDRMGRLKQQDGWIYQVAQWYPRACVYDDIRGWNTDPYLGAGEFYLPYGDVEYSITVPAGITVVGSGELLNPQECYTPTQQQRWARARESNQTIAIITADEVGSRAARPSANTLTWKFRCNNTRDVAWAASSAFILDAARINLPSGKKALAISAYPRESMKERNGNDWRRSTEYTKASIEFYSNYLYEYPYPAATNVAGIVGGMEYPGIVFCSSQATGSSLWGVTDHEFGHIWFPMIVGTNERRYAWMDEGFNTFINNLSTAAFNNGEYNSDMPMSALTPMLFNERMDGLYTLPDVIQQNNLGVAAYYKPSVMLTLLREEVLGKERFDKAFREYVHRWAFKHPTPWDFFRTIENVAGEDLAWFWRSWVLNSWKFDVAVKEVQQPRGNTARNPGRITLQLLEQMPLPVTVRVKDATGETYTLRLPVEVWQRGDTWTVPVTTKGEITEVVADPEGRLPDVNRQNNRWRK